MSKNPLEVLDMIMADVKADAEKFDGKPFTGKTMAEYMGNHGAAISALARILKELQATAVRNPCIHEYVEVQDDHDLSHCMKCRKCGHVNPSGYGGAGGGGRD